MIRRFSSIPLLLSGAVRLFLWAPLVIPRAHALELARRHPGLWREIVLARGVWVGTLELCLLSGLGAVVLARWR